MDPASQKRRQKALSPILEAQMRRGADRSFKWVTTLYPTEGFAREAEMGLKEFEDFVFRACHADETDPVAFWKKVEADQGKTVKRFVGHDQVVLRGPNVELTLSIKGRKFINAAGLQQYAGWGDFHRASGEFTSMAGCISPFQLSIMVSWWKVLN